jgi:hypothetical protein
VIQLLHTSFFGTWCQRGSEFIYLYICGTMNFMYLDLEPWFVITLYSYVCKTMWAWDIWLCACDVLFCFYSLRMIYARLKIFDECCFSLVFWKPGESGNFLGDSGFPGHSGFVPDSPDFLAPDFFFHPCWVHNLSWASHYYLLHVTSTSLV